MSVIDKSRTIKLLLGEFRRRKIGRGRLIMVVDDKADKILPLQLHLENPGYRVSGYTVDTYTDPLKALLKFKPHQYDLHLLDVKMPCMNGFQLYQAFKKIDNT